jgi:hypothetical protein
MSVPLPLRAKNYEDALAQAVAGVLPVVAASSEGEGDGQGGQGLERGHGTLLCCGVVRGFLPLRTISERPILFNFQ